jgi:membrane protein required for colicin V production
MNILDILIICTMVFLLVQGIIRGFLREIASLAGVVLGILLGSSFQPQMTEWLKAHVPDSSYLPVVSFALIFALVLIFCNILGYAVSHIFKQAFLGWVDRGLGVWLALTKGVIVTYLIIVLLTFFLPARTPLVAQSRLGPWIIVSYQSMIRFISPGRYEKWKSWILGKEEKTGKTVPEQSKDAKKKNGQK